MSCYFFIYCLSRTEVHSISEARSLEMGSVLDELLKTEIMALAASIDEQPESDFKREQFGKLEYALKQFRVELNNGRGNFDGYDIQGIIIKNYIPQIESTLENIALGFKAQSLREVLKAPVRDESDKRKEIVTEEEADRAKLQEHITGNIRANIKAEAAALATAHLAGVKKPVTHTRARIDTGKNTEHLFDKSESPATKFTEDAPPLMPPRSRM